MNHQQVFTHQLAHLDIPEFFIQNFLDASTIESKENKSLSSSKHHTLRIKGFLQRTFQQGIEFSDLVHHSRFSALLSCLFQFLGFTQGLLSMFGTKDSATIRGIYKYITFLFDVRAYFKYHRAGDGFKYLHFPSLLKTFHSVSIVYLPLNQGMSFIKVIKKIVYRMRYSTLGTLSSARCNVLY